MDLSLLGISFEPQHWQDQAKCRSVTDPDRFYPERGGSSAAAIRLCKFCPVKQACLEYAVENDEEFGVWGGMTALERERWAQNVKSPQPAETDQGLLRSAS